MTTAIGIDLGTTNSCEAIEKDGHVIVFENDLGDRTTPSCVSFDDVERLIGKPAMRKAGSNPTNTVYGIKRLMGRNFNDPEVQSDIKHWPFKVIEKNGKPYSQVKYKNKIVNFTPEEISSMILSKMKERAEEKLNHSVTDAVITVPAYFNDSQRKATIDAGKIAGLNVLRIINEPTAAAIAYGLYKKSIDNKNILIIDLGGGTYDVSLLNINNGNIKVKAVSGDTHLGGEDFNNHLVDHFVEVFKNKHRKDISSNPKSMCRLRIACEQAKCILSSSVRTTISVECLYNGIDFESNISRSYFEELCSDLFDKLIPPIDVVLKDSNLSKSDIHDIVLVGGSTRIPRVEEIILDYFDGKELMKSINPDEAVAQGAAVLASILSGNSSEQIRNLTLSEVTPLSLGISIKGDIMSTIIKRNSTIPIKKTEVYYTVKDDQTSASIEVYEGERTLSKDNHLLDKFTLYGITPAPRGETKIDVTFDIDKNGILNVRAEEKNTGNYKEIFVDKNKGKLYQNEIDKLIEEAEKYKENDKKEMKRIQSMNDLESYAYKLRRSISNLNISSNVNNKIKAINTTIDWINNNQNASIEECEKIRSKLENLSI
eukprot:jgi/Orpsp1_1/1177382/evm.model.c7180000061246.1